MKESIGSKIKALRTALQLTQEELAVAASTTKQTIHKYETGIISNIPASKIKSIADKLQTTPAYLMGWADEQTQKKNDALADIILKARRDEDLIELIKELCDLSPEHRQSVKAFLTLLKQQNVDNMK
jgi:transcriptional regulator with XRE-family HTH domain